jgi:hypothetical protein
MGEQNLNMVSPIPGNQFKYLDGYPMEGAIEQG